MDVIMNGIFGQEHAKSMAFLDGLRKGEHYKLASSFLLTQNISAEGGLYTKAAHIEVGQALLTRDVGQVEITAVQPLRLDGASAIPIIRIDKGRFVNGRELVLSPLHLVRCDIEHMAGIDHEPGHSADGITLMQPVYKRASDLIDGDTVKLDLMLTTQFVQITLQKDATIYVEGQAIKVAAAE